MHRFLEAHEDSGIHANVCGHGVVVNRSGKHTHGNGRIAKKVEGAQFSLGYGFLEAGLICEERGKSHLTLVIFS